MVFCYHGTGKNISGTEVNYIGAKKAIYCPKNVGRILYFLGEREDISQAAEIYPYVYEPPNAKSTVINSQSSPVVDPYFPDAFVAFQVVA